MIKLYAPAKLNLNLHITGRLATGYHSLQSLVVFVDTSDTLTASFTQPTESYPYCHHYADIGVILHVHPHIQLDTNFFAHNLIYQAAKSIHSYTTEYHNQPTETTHITLEKYIPIGAGLGGGSSDAAATLRLLNQLWRLRLAQYQLTALASDIGSDIVTCLDPEATWMSGTGNTISPADIKADLWAVIAYPNIPLSSADVYQALNHNPTTMHPLPAFETFRANNAEALLTYLNQTKNHLTESAITCVPNITDILAALATLPSAKLTRMSGSGSACYALFTSESAATQAKQQLTSEHPDWWITKTMLIM